ncbi:MAG: hypothetical protein IKU84_03175 [Clostridia bacterium]|nr:hypothetical protein [Clostridia bacterium]
MLLLIVVGAAIGVIFGLKETATGDRDWKTKDYTPAQIKGLIINFVFMMICFIAMAFGISFNEGTVIAIGLIGWAITSLIASNIASPFKLLMFNGENQGCAYFLYLPVIAAASVSSFALIAATSWFFSLIVIIKNKSKCETSEQTRKVFKKAIIITVIATLVIIVVTAAINVLNAFSQKRAEEKKVAAAQLVWEQTLDKIEDAIDDPVDKINFTEEELDIAQEYYDCYIDNDIFCTEEVREMLAERFSELYRERDFDGILELLDFADLNGMPTLVTFEDAMKICFTDDFIDDLSAYIVANGVFLEEDSKGNKTYEYKDKRIEVSEKGDCVMDRDLTRDFENYDAMLDTLTKYNREISYIIVGENLEYGVVAE